MFHEKKFFHKNGKDFSPKNGKNFFAQKYSKTHFYAISRIYQKSKSDQIRPNPTKSNQIRRSDSVGVDPGGTYTKENRRIKTITDQRTRDRFKTFRNRNPNKIRIQIFPINEILTLLTET